MNEQDLKQSILSQEDSLVSPFPWLESKKVKGTTVISGLKCSELSESLRQLGYSVRTYLESSRLPADKYVRTWSVRDTLSPFLIMKLRLSERRTEERGCSSSDTGKMWRTATSRDYKDTPGMNLYRGYSTLPIEVYREERNARLWGTPDTMSALPPRTGEKMQKMLDGAGKHRPSNLREQVVPDNLQKFWRTPDAHCDRGAKARETYIRKSEKGLPISINDQATHGDFRTIDERPESAKGQLNPEWVEQLMGFERGWTEV